MATRTFRGTIDDSWDNPNNWLEGIVPVGGDDVVFDNLSGNCTLYSDVVFSPRLRSMIMTGYTGTFNFNGHKIAVGIGKIEGNMLIIDSTCIITGTGEIELYSTSTSPDVYNIIQLNNVGLSGIDVRFLADANGKQYHVLGPNVYMHSLIIPYYTVSLNSAIQSFPNGMHIYGDVLILTDNPLTYFNSIRLEFQGTQVLTLHGNGIINMNNVTLINFFATINIEGNYTCIDDFKIFIYSHPHTINITGNLNTIGVFKIVPQGYINPSNIINLNIINMIGKLQIYNMAYAMSIRLLSDLIIKDLFIVEHFNNNSFEFDGQGHTITLDSKCKYLLLSTSFKNVSFNKLINAFYCLMTNVTNMVNIEHPYTNVLSF